MYLWFFFLIGCGGGEKDYWPLAVGNIWDYQVSTTVTMPDTTITFTDTMKIEVTRETTLDNNTAVFEVITEMTVDTIVTTDTAYYQETDEYVFAYDEKSTTNPDTLLVLPIEEGKSWTVHKDSLETITMEVVGKETVTVPAGTYEDCWKGRQIQTDGTDAETMYVWLAPDVGWIKQTFTEGDTNFTTSTTVELLNATIK